MCAGWFANLWPSPRSLWFRVTPQTHESPALIYLALGERRPQRQVILEYNADGANKSDEL